MESKKYYKDINFIRLLACISVLLYHLNILKGGYLAVCVFFVLSSYLSCKSAFNKEKFSLLSYYSNRLLKIYLPLLIVSFISVTIISLFSSITWLNLKPETTSVIFGYNNFWQLSANLDYFARHVSSPFMHLWYIAILLQFELIFPFVYLILRKIGDKIHKLIPCIITGILSVIAALYFYKTSLTQNIMFTYYDTFSRSFSLIFGLFLGFMHSYYGSFIPKIFKNKIISKIIFYAYTLVLIYLFITIDSQDKLFPFAMILSSIITCRLIDYGTINTTNNLSILDKIIKFFSDRSYEIYLFQYPVIFLFQYITIDNYLKLSLIIVLIIALSCILHFCLNFKNKKFKILKSIVFIIILSISLYGVYKYILAKDHTAEMKLLEQQLSQNQEMIQKKQEEYASKAKQEEDEWKKALENLENGEIELKNMVSNLSVVGIGDSVMLGAVRNLYDTFPNGYFDAATSRTAYVAPSIIQNLKSRNILGNPVIINLGANGDCPENCKIDIIKKCEDRDIFWINVTNDRDVHVNDKLNALATTYPNLHIIDWKTISNGHPEYFISDGIHLTTVGKEVYVKAIYDAIYGMYLKEYNEMKDKIIKEHEAELQKKITFYGNDLLLNIFDDIQNNFSDANFVMNKQFNYEILKSDIEKEVRNNTLNKNVVFIFDSTFNLSLDEYNNLVNLCNNHEIYIISTNKQVIENLSNINDKNVTLINFYKEIKEHPNYLMADNIHLTEDGNNALNQILSDYLDEKVMN